MNNRLNIFLYNNNKKNLFFYLNKRINKNKYILRILEEQQFFSEPWEIKAKLLIIPDNLKIKFTEKMKNYLNEGGLILSIGNSLIINEIKYKKIIKEKELNEINKEFKEFEKFKIILNENEKKFKEILINEKFLIIEKNFKNNGKLLISGNLFENLFNNK
jgi:hypothetical protein